MKRLYLEDYSIEQNKLQTKEIQSVLDEATMAGGLEVVIPRGVYIAGTLNLGSASLYLEKGAVLKASGEFEDYTDNGFVHNEMRKTISFLYSMHHEDICIHGEGIIDLSGDSFYDMETVVEPAGCAPLNEEQKKECTRPIGKRPTQPIFFYDCRNITVRDITIKNAPCWTMSFHACEDIRILDLIIRNNMILPNNDGMHFCGSRNVVIRGCNITSGDDCIALSGITDWDRPCENFVIADCVLRSVSKAVVFGYIHSIIRNVTMSNCVIYDSQRGICIMSSKGTGVVEHILVDNVRIDTHVRAGNWWGNGEAIEIMGLWHDYEGYLMKAPDRYQAVNVRDIQLKNISCTSENVIAIVGEDNMEDIVLDGINFEKKDSRNRYIKGDRCIDVSPSKALEPLPDGGEYWLYVKGCDSLYLRNEIVKEYKGTKLEIKGRPTA